MELKLLDSWDLLCSGKMVSGWLSVGHLVDVTGELLKVIIRRLQKAAIVLSLLQSLPSLWKRLVTWKDVGQRANFVIEKYMSYVKT